MTAERQPAPQRPVHHDPLLDLLARMIRHAHDSGHRPGRGTLTVMEGGKR